jgi:hypothetical protein
LTFPSFLAHQIKKMSTSFSRARVTRAFPRIFVFLLSQPSPSPSKIGGEFSYGDVAFWGTFSGDFSPKIIVRVKVVKVKR